MTHKKILRAVLITLITLFLLLVLLVVLLITFDWNRARPFINRRVSHSLQRDFAIDGNLSVSWQREQPIDDAASQNHARWKRWLPWPHITAENVRLSNPEWINDAPQMVRLQTIAITLNPWPLLKHTVDLPDIALTAPDLDIERLKDGRNNWTFASSGPSTWKLAPHRVAISDGHLRFRDAISRINAEGAVFSEPVTPEGYGLGWKLAGSYHDAPLNTAGQAGMVLSAEDLNAPYPLKGTLQVGKTHITVAGTLTSPLQLRALDVKLSLSGASMANLYPLTGVLLPDTPPFSTQGHLIGTLDGQNSRWRYEQFTGKVGGSDINGTLLYVAQPPRPKLSGNITSHQLVFTDLAPLIGADSNASKKNRGAETLQPSDKVLPTEKFNTQRWNALDADVTFTAEHIIRDKSLPINDLSTHLIMDDKKLTLTPLKFGVAGGSLVSTIELEGNRQPIGTRIDLAARHLKIRELFPQLESMRASFGEVNGSMKLEGNGDSVAEMLAGANGQLKTNVTSGTMSKFILEAIGLNVGNLVISKLFGDKQVQLNCLASDFHIKNGLVDTQKFVMDTDDAVVNVTGTANLSTETMDFNIRPQSKGLRIFSLRSPLYAKGTFKHPDVGVNKTVIAAKAGAAIALATVAAPIAAVLPLINPGRVEPIDCAEALKDIDIPASAPHADPVSLRSNRQNDERSRTAR